MAEPKDTTSFFRKVVKFVANPATDWTDSTRPTRRGARERFAKGELKAMIERKRRNDFVRKREFDMLRKVRREGLSSEQLAALGGSSRIDDSEGRASPTSPAPAGRRRQGQDRRDRAADGRRRLREHAAPRPRVLQRADPAGADRSAASRRPPAAVPAAASPIAHGGRASRTSSRRARHRRRQRRRLGAGVPRRWRRSASTCLPPTTSARPFAVEVSEVAHDPDLDEAVIAFANADFEQCEQSLAALTGPGGIARHSMPRPGSCCSTCTARSASSTSSRAWRSTMRSSSAGRRRSGFRCRKLVAEAASEERPTARSRVDGQVGWVCPELPRRRWRSPSCRRRACRCRCPGCSTGARCRTSTPRPAAGCRSCSAAGSARSWTCAGSAASGSSRCCRTPRPPACAMPTRPIWQLRLDALRMANRPDQFDEAAIDYCVTYEVSPPSWEPAQCEVRISGTQLRHHVAAAVGRQRRVDQLSSSRSSPTIRPVSRSRSRASSCRASWSATSARR